MHRGGQISASVLPSGYRFDRICWEHGVEHRLTKPTHRWTNGQVERMNRTIKEAAEQHYQTRDELSQHLQAFLLAYNHAKRLKTLRTGLRRPNLSVLSGKRTQLSLSETRLISRWNYTARSSSQAGEILWCAR